MTPNRKGQTRQMKHHTDATPKELNRVDETASLQPIDLAYLERTTFSDKDLAAEVLRLFRASAGGYLEALKSAQTPKDWYEAAHSLKGSAKAVGAFRLAELAAAAEAIEASPQGAPMTDLQQEALLDLQHHLDEVFWFIDQYLASH